MATTRRPDLSKKTDSEVYDLLGFHVAEPFKRISSTKTAVLTVEGGEVARTHIDSSREKAEPDVDHIGDELAKAGYIEGDEMVGDFDPEEDVEVDTKPTTTVKKPKPKKAKKPEPEEDDDFDPFADPEEEDDHKEEEQKLTSEDVRLALKAFSVIHSREAAVEIMIKVAKTDSVTKIDPKHYAKIIELAKIKRAKK